MKSSIFRGALVAATLACSGLANASYIVGGVEFGSVGFNIDTTTLAETYINGDGQHLLGYGVINTVNGLGNYSVNGTDKLYFTFDYTVKGFTPTSSGFYDGEIKVFKGAEVNLMSQSSAANLLTIGGYSEWVKLNGHAATNPADLSYELYSTGTLTGASISFFGSGLLDVDTSGTFGLASVIAALDSDKVSDLIGGTADVLIGTNGNNSPFSLNQNDPIGSCSSRNPTPGAWCIAGAASLAGQTLPEPGSLALIGLGILGLAGIRRRKI